MTDMLGNHEATEIKSKSFENYLIIILSANAKDFDHANQNPSPELLHQMCNRFTQVDECIDFITDVDDQLVLLIIDQQFIQELIPFIHPIPHLRYIFVLGNVNETYLYSWYKIRGVYKTVRSIFDNIVSSTKQSEDNCLPFSFVHSSKDITNINPDQLEPSFMYTTLFKNIFLKMDYNEQYRTDFIEYCRTTRSDHFLPENKILDDFEKNYRSENAIHWYTRESFLYKMLNRALRLLDVDSLIHMGFFVADLHRQIEQLYHEQIASYKGQPLTVYRGQILSKTDVERLQECEGGLISFNNFLSTSMDSIIPTTLASSAAEAKDTYGILFVIIIDPEIQGSCFAHIRHLSSFTDEREILFSMHSIFRINSIQQIRRNERQYKVQLTFSDFDDTCLRLLVEEFENRYCNLPIKSQLLFLVNDLNSFEVLEKFIRTFSQQDHTYATENVNVLHMIATVNHSHGDHQSAMIYREKALQVVTNNYPDDSRALGICHLYKGNTFLQTREHPNALKSYMTALAIFEKSPSVHSTDLASLHVNIGNIYLEMGAYPQALTSYISGLTIFQKILSENHPDLGSTHSNIGLVFLRMGEYSQALSSFKKSLAIFERSIPADHPSMAKIRNSIGNIYCELGEFSQGLASLNIALSILEKNRPENHLSLAILRNNIGNVYFEIGEYSQALTSFLAILTIFESNLPTNDTNLASLHSSIGSVYCEMEEYPRALVSLMKALEIRYNNSSENSPDVAILHAKIGGVYRKVGKYTEALESFKKAEKMFGNNLPENHPQLVFFHNNIGNVYWEMGEHSQAMACFRRALAISEKHLPVNHPQFGLIHGNIGNVYSEMGEYSQAISAYMIGLTIFERSLPTNHPYLASYSRNIGLVCSKIGRYSQALASFMRTLTIFKNILPANHPDLAEIYQCIGNCELHNGNYVGVINALEQAYEILRSHGQRYDIEVNQLRSVIQFSLHMVNTH